MWTAYGKIDSEIKHPPVVELRKSKLRQIEHFTGFGLYDRSFVEVLRQLHDPMPFTVN